MSQVSIEHLLNAETGWDLGRSARNNHQLPAGQRHLGRESQIDDLLAGLPH